MALRSRDGRHALPCHLFLAAIWAISRRRLAESATARAFPPLRPPSRPSATAAGFFLRRLSLSVCRMTWRKVASATSSRMRRFELDRLGMSGQGSHNPREFSRSRLSRLLSRNAGFHASGSPRRPRAGCAGRALWQRGPRQKAGKFVRQFFHALEASEQVRFRHAQPAESKRGPPCVSVGFLHFDDFWCADRQGPPNKVMAVDDNGNQHSLKV
jgi:hypothetical protein